MLRRFALVLMLLAGLALVPLARASQACCEAAGCDHAMPACVSVCALCASAVAVPAAAPLTLLPAPARLGPATLAIAFDDWIDEIWSPPD